MDKKANNTAQNVIVDFKNVLFGYEPNKPILKNVSFSINENEYVCIIGHNGCGKSTVSKVMVGLLKPQAGQIHLFKQEIKDINIKNLRDNVGIVFQNPDSQFIGFTAEDDIAFGLENRKIDPEKMWPIIKEVAEIVDIKNLLKYDAMKLSGGQKQRVAIAGVLAIDPKIIIFDESTSMLDPKAKLLLKNLMVDLKTKYHKTVISITHDMEEVVNADKVIVMNDGQIVQVGTPAEVFAQGSKLHELSLDYPFAYKLSKKLNELGYKVSPTIKLNELVSEMKDVK